MRFKLFEKFVNEGINDPGILKAFFMAGGPGSGKSYVASELFGFPKAATSSVSYATGLKLVNNDNAFEKAIKEAGYDIGKLADYAKDPEVWSKVMAIRDKAKGLTRRMQGNYISGRLGQVIDGTGKDFKKIAGMRKMYADLGYDTYMVFVNTSLETALERNKMRPRKLDDGMVEKMWKAVQDNLGKFQKEFGSVNMIIVDNNATDDEEGILDQIEKQIMKRIKDPVNNVLGKRWISDNSPENRNKNQPYGVRESVNENNLSTLKRFVKDFKMEYGPTPTPQSLADFIYDNYEDVTGEKMGESDPSENYFIADILSHFKIDGEEFMIAWEDRTNESLQEAKFTDYDNNELAAYVKNNPKDKEAAKELSKRSKKLRDLSRTDESVNEAASISAKMPASMKRWIMGEVKSRPDTWSNELTDLTNEIVSIYREMDLDLMKSEAGPEWIDVRNLPVSELTTRCVEKINEIWPQMSEWAKEYIYSDYSHWFKVGKKDRPHYGETD